jgi:hypothetical protein
MMKIARKIARRGWRSESGVAMVTVLFVGAALTAVASAAAFTTVREFRAGSEDRKASEALAIAEAGIDRIVEKVRGGSLDWGKLRLAGCNDGHTDHSHPTLITNGRVGVGTFDARFEVFNPAATGDARFPPAACTASPTNPRSPSARVDQFFAITSVGTHPDARRVVRQVIRIGDIGLPVGVYADSVKANGSPDFNGISLLSDKDVEGRDKMSFSGTDPFYFLNDFWPGQSATVNTPAAVHSLGTIYLKKLLRSTEEHPPSKACDANAPGGTVGQSIWDQSGRGGAIGGVCAAPFTWPGSPTGADDPPGPASGSFPPNSLIESLVGVTPKPALSDQDYLAIKNTAQREGLYCFISKTGVQSCTRRGLTWSPGNLFSVTVKQTDTDDVLKGPDQVLNTTDDVRSFVAYFEYEDQSQAQGLNQVNWNASVSPCSDNQALHRSVVVVVRNGSYRGEGGHVVNGAVLVPEGTVTLQGGHTIHGTVIAKEVDLKGNSTFQLSPCWVRNMPGPFLDLTPARWSEVDR